MFSTDDAMKTEPQSDCDATVDAMKYQSGYNTNKLKTKKQTNIQAAVSAHKDERVLPRPVRQILL